MPTFLQLKNQFQRWIIDNNSTLTTETDVLINKGYVEIQKRHNFKIMEATTSATPTTAISTTNITRKLTTVPSDWKEKRAKPWIITVDGNIKQIDWLPSQEQAKLLYDDNTTVDKGEPEYLLEVATSAGSELVDLEVYPYPDQLSDHADGNWRIVVPYWRYLPDLSADGDNNFITNRFEWAILYHALAHGFRLQVDHEQATIYTVLAEAEFKREIRLDKKKKFGRTGVLKPRTGVNGSFNQRSF